MGSNAEEIVGPVFFFLAVFGIVAVYMWRKVTTERERQATVRLAIERGQQLDATLVEKLLTPANAPRSMNPILIPAGLISAGVGLAVLGAFVRQIDDEPFWVFLGIGSMVAIIGFGVLLGVIYGRRLINTRG